MSDKKDQDDVISENARLKQELQAARDEAARLQTQVQELTDSGAKHLSATKTLSGQVEDLKGQVATVTAERDKLAGESRDFERRVAAELTRHGIRPKGVADQNGSASGGTDLAAQYLAIQDPKGRADFMAKHGDDLRKLILQN